MTHNWPQSIAALALVSLTRIPNKMRCLIVHNYYQKRGGEDAVFEAEAALLASAGHDVKRFTLHNDAVSNHSGIRLAVATVWNGQVHEELRRLLHEFKPDIVHFHNTFPLISLAALHAAKASGAAVVMTLHNFRFLCPSANLYRDGHACEDCLALPIKWPSLLHKCYRDSLPATATIAAMLAIHRAGGSPIRFVDRFIALCNHSRNLFIKGGFPSERIVVKPNFVTGIVAAPDVTRSQDHPPAKPFALFVGRLVAEKGILTLLQAWRHLEDCAVPLLVVGDGPLATQVVDAGDMVQWVGRKSGKEVHDLMQRASFLIFPSEWFEPFGLVIVEAFANGLPVVAARAGAAEELIDPGRTGFLFEHGNASSLARVVRHALKSEQALAKMREAARQEFIAKYTPERNLNLLLDIYSDAVACNGAVKRRRPESLYSDTRAHGL